MIDCDYFEINKSEWLHSCNNWPQAESLKTKLKSSLNKFGLYILRSETHLNNSEKSKSILKSYLGKLGYLLNQSPTGSDLFEVKDEGFDMDHPKFRGPSSNHQLTFHTDRCDVIVFYCVRPADIGGINKFVRAQTIYNVLRDEYPDLLTVLEQPFIYKKHNADPAFPDSQYELPVFDKSEDGLYITLMTYLINKADNDPDMPNLTNEQRMALSKMQEVCQRKENQLEIKLEAGDLLFLNNTQMLHSRTAFEDKLGKRLYYRIWMTFPWSEELPESFEPIFGKTKAGKKRGGFRLLEN